MPVVFLFQVRTKGSSWEVIVSMNRADREIKEVPLVLLGLGMVGGALLQQVLSTREALQREAGISLRLVGLADSTGFLADPSGLTDRLLTEIRRAKAAGRSLDEMERALPLSDLRSLLRPGTLLVDATASTETLSILKGALEAGCGIILANKLPLAGPFSEAAPLFAHPLVRYEATVGAGLPVISTLRTLINTGDRFIRSWGS